MLVDTVCVVDEHGRFVFVSASCERLLGYTPEELIGRNMIDFVHPDDRKRTLHSVSDIMSGVLKTHFENRYLRKDGRVVDIMWSARWSEPDRLRLAVARDVTELRRASRLQGALYRISEAAHAAHGLYELYQHIHQVIAELIPAENFAVALYDQDTGELSFPYYVDQKERPPAPQALTPGTPLADIIKSGKSMFMAYRRQGTAEARGPCMDWLGVPLVWRNGVLGALVLRTYAGDVCYSEEDRDLLQFVSAQIATAIERKRQETRLHHMARHDALTDLPNRMLFADRLDTAVKRARRSQERLGLLFLDLDGFKEVNDTFGHDLGDRLLLEVARRLQGCVRESDTIGRMGGDEFTILLVDIREPACAGVIADKIRAALDAPYEWEGRMLTLSASIGTATYPEDGDAPEQLLRRADARMYAVKRREPDG